METLDNIRGIKGTKESQGATTIINQNVASYAINVDENLLIYLRTRSLHGSENEPP